jgi:hypothetical protein
MKKQKIAAALAFVALTPLAGAQVIVQTQAPFGQAQAPFGQAQGLSNPLGRKFMTPDEVVSSNVAAFQTAPTPNMTAAMEQAGLAPSPQSSAPDTNPSTQNPPQPAQNIPANPASPGAAIGPATGPTPIVAPTTQPKASAPSAQIEPPPPPRYIPDTDYNRQRQQYYDARGAKQEAQFAMAHSGVRSAVAPIIQSPADLAQARELISSLRAQGVDESKIRLELSRRNPAQFRRWAAESLR